MVLRYEAQLEKDWLYILNDSQSKLVFVGSESIYEKTKGYIGTVGYTQLLLHYCIHSFMSHHCISYCLQQHIVFVIVIVVVIIIELLVIYSVNITAVNCRWVKSSPSSVSMHLRINYTATNDG